MINWKNLLLNQKLAISYAILILVFIIAGIFTGINLNKYKKELATTNNAYIPLVENTNRIERLTNQAMSFLWEYNALGDIEYYNLSKSSLSELSSSIDITDSIISSSLQLSQLKTRLMRIKTWVDELNTIIDETAEIKKELENTHKSIRTISKKISEETFGFYISEQNKIRNALGDSLLTYDQIEQMRSRTRKIAVVNDKGNRAMNTALEVIISEDPQHLKSALNEFKYIFKLLYIADSLFERQNQKEHIELIRNHYQIFKGDLYNLQKGLKELKALSLKQLETANVVIYEATKMGEDGIFLSGQALQNNYDAFNRLIPIYTLGFIIALILAVIFSVIITRSITIPLEKSVQFAEEIASGNLDASVQIENYDEVGILAKSLKYMREKLKENIASLKRVERQMLTVSIETEEKERKRIAEDLHDSLGPLLSTIKLFINALKDSSIKPSKQKYLIDNTEKIINESIASVKNIAHNLLPHLLNDFGLDMAIQSFCNQLRQASEIKINYYSKDYPSDFNRKVEIMLFRIIKELLNNTLKHANASEININMYLGSKHLYIEYSDDGDGFVMDKLNIPINSKNGLVNVFNRINYINGEIDFKSELGEGVYAKLWIDKHTLS